MARLKTTATLAVSLIRAESAKCHFQSRRNEDSILGQFGVVLVDSQYCCSAHHQFMDKWLLMSFFCHLFATGPQICRLLVHRFFIFINSVNAFGCQQIRNGNGWKMCEFNKVWGEVWQIKWKVADREAVEMSNGAAEFIADTIGHHGN